MASKEQAKPADNKDNKAGDKGADKKRGFGRGGDKKKR